MKTKILATILLLASFNVFSAGYSNWAVPTTIELVSGGLLIHGAFGDPNGCGKGDFIFVNEQSSTYKSTLSIALSALHTKSEMRLYSSTCTSVSFHWAGDVINENKSGQAIYIR